jgi:hypothetical protein
LHGVSQAVYQTVKSVYGRESMGEEHVRMSVHKIWYIKGGSTDVHTAAEPKQGCKCPDITKVVNMKIRG